MRADLPQVRALTGGRLHLSHGPIDVVLCAWGAPAEVAAAYTAAAKRFGDILPELCAELPLLRAPIREGASLTAGPTGFPSPSRRRRAANMWGGVRGGG